MQRVESQQSYRDGQVVQLGRTKGQDGHGDSAFSEPFDLLICPWRIPDRPPGEGLTGAVRGVHETSKRSIIF